MRECVTNIAKRNEVYGFESGNFIHGTCRPGWLILPLVPATLRCGAGDSIFVSFSGWPTFPNWQTTCSEFGKKKREEMNVSGGQA